MQTEYIGRGQISSIILELEKIDAKHILLITGKGSYLSSGAKNALTPILGNYDVISFNEFSPNPTFTEVMAGVEICRSKDFDVIIAIGGGSCIDVAKSINAFAAHPELEEALTKGEKKVYAPLLPLIAIPTTAGTGSEATHFSVIYLNGKKYSLASPALMPTVSVIDASLTDSLPAYITACTGFDALCQAIESYWANSATIASREHASKAIKLLINSLPDAVKLSTRKARDDIMLAANMAGKAINATKTTAPHALSYAITSKYGLAHGHAVALTLGAFFPLHNELLNSGCSYAESLPSTMQDLYRFVGVKDADQAVIKWYSLMEVCGLETDFKKLGINKEDAEKIVAQVNMERLANHPIKLSPNMLISVFESRIKASNL